MSCKIEIGTADDYVFATIEKCGEINNILFTFPAETTQFFIEGKNRGIVDKAAVEVVDGVEVETNYLIVEPDNRMLGYRGPNAEVNVTIPSELIQQFVEYVDARGEKPVTEYVVFKSSGDPQPLGGKVSARKLARIRTRNE